MDQNLIIRILVLVVAFANQLLVYYGKSPIPFADETIYETISILVTIGATLWTSWENNNITNEAKTAQMVLDALKQGQITSEAVDNFLMEYKEEE